MKAEKLKIINVVGARPNFVKISPIMAQYRNFSQIEALLVHTGQHYDWQMSESFFCQLDIPRPDINLEVGSASHAVQTANIIRAFEPVVLEHKPDAVVVVGDVNSTVACSLVSAKLGVKIIHVEAGLRSFDRTMPEEINRILTDAVSDLLFCTEQSGVDNLIKEGVPEKKIFLVGNVMIDTLIKSRPKADQSNILKQLNLNSERYAVLTLHRPSNVDDTAIFSGILDALEVIQQDMPIIFPVHPRTRSNLLSNTLGKKVELMPNLRLVEPMGYIDFLRLVCSAGIVLTDSGGIQEETTFLKVPCLTLRNNTERPVTTQFGTNRLVGAEAGNIISAYKDVLNVRHRDSQIPPLWDGHAAERIVKIIVENLLPC